MGFKFLDYKVVFKRGDFCELIPLLQENFFRKSEATIKRMLEHERTHGYDYMTVLFTGHGELKEYPHIPVGCVDWEINNNSSKNQKEITIEEAIELKKEAVKAKREIPRNGYMYKYQ